MTVGVPQTTVPPVPAAVHVHATVPVAHVPPSTSCDEHDVTVTPSHPASGRIVHVHPEEELQHVAHSDEGSHDESVCAFAVMSPQTHPSLPNAQPTCLAEQSHWPEPGHCAPAQHTDAVPASADGHARSFAAPAPAAHVQDEGSVALGAQETAADPLHPTTMMPATQPTARTPPATAAHFIARS